MVLDPLHWLKENVHIFIDQNIKQKVHYCLLTRGFQKVSDVYSIGHVGANDGKLLNLIKENKMILVTFDKHFYKQAMKYNNKMAFLLRCKPNHEFSALTIARKIDQYLIHNWK